MFNTEQLKVKYLSEDSHPYVVFLPSEQKSRILGAIFGSKAAVDILKFSLNQGISNKIYQKDLVKKLAYSNKTIIENLKSLTKLGVLEDDMEKSDKEGRIVWVKVYQLTHTGKWFALLLAKEKDLSEKEKAVILQNVFRTYVKWVKDLSEKLHVNKKTLEDIFREEM
jgi:DNA-binding PadR family transcriptional regulator